MVTALLTFIPAKGGGGPGLGRSRGRASRAMRLVRGRDVPGLPGRQALARRPGTIGLLPGVQRRGWPIPRATAAVQSPVLVRMAPALYGAAIIATREPREFGQPPATSPGEAEAIG